MNYKIEFTGEDADLAMATLAKSCKQEPSTILISKQQSKDAEKIERALEMSIVVGIAAAATGVIHLAKFVYDIVQQRKVEISITDEYGITYKFRKSVKLSEIEQKLALSSQTSTKKK